MAFHVGQRVTMKDDALWDIDPHEIPPEFGAVYTIRTITARKYGCYIRLHEIHNVPHEYEDGHEECDFAADEFRPVVERKTDISIFQAMLSPKPKKARERA